MDLVSGPRPANTSGLTPNQLRIDLDTPKRPHRCRVCIKESLSLTLSVQIVRQIT
jgi:hypothetical protein